MKKKKNFMLEGGGAKVCETEAGVSPTVGYYHSAIAHAKGRMIDYAEH